MNKEHRKFQAAVLKKYREQELLPSLNSMALAAGVSIGTAALFMRGNSTNAELRKYVRRRATTLSEMPTDLNELIKIWDELP